MVDEGPGGTRFGLMVIRPSSPAPANGSVTPSRPGGAAAQSAGARPGAPGTLEAPGSGAVVAHLLWGQAVGGSNPPSPTGYSGRCNMRASFNGRTSLFQGDDAGSIPVARSGLLSSNPAGGQSSRRNASYFRPRKMR